ncbi:MAG TPA: hypothetical protein VHO06_27420 [Polyangia bacterium]|nr:hypothetical protein [Polyangia bacterium]
MNKTLVVPAVRRAPSPNRLLVVMPLTALLSTWSACASKAADGTSSGPGHDAAAVDAGKAAHDASTSADGPVMASTGTCPASTVVCNGYCLATGQSAAGCQALVAGVPAQTMTVTAGYVYYDAPSAIWRVPAGGGTPMKFVTAPQFVYALAADANNLYLTGEGTDGTVIDYVPLTGGTLQILHGGDQGDPPFGGIALDGTHVYWLEEPISDGAHPAIFQVPIAGGPVVTVGVAATPTALAIDTHDVYWVDSSRVWRRPLATLGTTSLDAGPAAGGPIELLNAPINEAPTGLASDGSYLYYVDGSALARLPADGADGSAGDSLATYDGATLILDGTDVYFTTLLGQLVRYRISDATSEVLATFASGAAGPIAADANSVYLLLTPIGENIHGVVRIAK